MPHTFSVNGRLRIALAAAALLLPGRLSLGSSPDPWAAALERAARLYPEAAVAIVDVPRGRLLEASRRTLLAENLAAPGSTLKPIILYQSLAAGLWSADRRLLCRRDLEIRGHRLTCSHPSSPPFDARGALAWSCNTYFAALARTLPPARIEGMLRPTGILGPTGLAGEESVADFRPPSTAEDAGLTVLGLAGVRVTGLELAAAYRWLALRLSADSGSAAATTVLGGMTDSAGFGIAGSAHSDRVVVAGKTGTAPNPGSPRTHGWFAGFAPAARPRIVIVVYLPAGEGMDAARVAGAVLDASPPGAR